MSLLARYRDQEQRDDTLQTLGECVDKHLHHVKEHAETIEQRWMTDEAFQHSIASLCLSVEQFRLLIKEAEASIDRFLSNTFKKWRIYTEIQQEMLCLLNAKNIDSLDRLYRVDRSSNCNVIKVGRQHVELEQTNKALVPPFKSASDSVALPVPQLDIFQSDTAVRKLVTRATNVVIRFTGEERKIRVYQLHYEQLCALDALTADEKTAFHLDSIVLEHDQCGIISREVRCIEVCFRKMRGILYKECVNCQPYLLNTDDRFVECSLTYNRLISYLREHSVQLPCLQQQQQTRHANEPAGCCSMYQRIDGNAETIL